MPVVICGGGIIGAAIAYHLALKGVKSMVVERCWLACAASGKAGGFLARDWCDSYELGPLARKSFDMHMEMSKTFTDCDYRRMDTYSVTFVEGRPTGHKGAVPEWVDGPATNHSKLGQMETTAQVHPYKLTHALLAKAKEMAGTEVVIDTVTGMQIEEGKITGVKTKDKIIEADVVVVAMGPWSGQASEWFQLPPVTGQRAHSLRLRPKKPVPGNALFADYRTRDGQSFSPEVYPRPNDEVYVCGMSDEVALPVDPSKVLPNENSIRKLKRMAETMSSHLLDAEVLSSQACYLPLPSDGLPLIGAVPNVSGAYIATGHTCWGILNAPGTGAAIAELIVDGNSSVVDISPFDPARHL